MKKTTLRVLSLVLSVLMVLVITGCSKSNTSASESASESAGASSDIPLVVAYSPFSEKFSPFFAETGYDMDVINMTTISPLTMDRLGAIVFNAIEGETHSYNGTDYLYTGPADVSQKYDSASDTTLYTIKLRNDLVFSDGVAVTADDMIFSLYAFCDPGYTGPTTVSSYKIVGLKAYQNNNSLAEDVDAAAYLAGIDTNPDLQKAINEQVVAPLLTSELDWVKGLYGDATYKSYTDAYPVAKDLFAMFYSIDENYDSTKVDDEATVLSDIIAQYGYDYATLGSNYGADLTADAQSVAFDMALASMGTGEPVPSIEGIKRIDDYTITITTKGYEAPAIYTLCGFPIAPLHYYGDTAKYDFANNKFGFDFGKFALTTDQQTKPLGAGPYKFVKYENKIVYFEANENYYDGAPKIKYLQFKETLTDEVTNAVATGTVDCGELSGSKSNFNAVRALNSNSELSGDKIVTEQVDNLGYGYIGLNAANVCVNGDAASDASKNLRKALATVLASYRDVANNSYYGDAAATIQYPISSTSWAAPQPTDDGYKIAFSTDVNGNEIYTDGQDAAAREKAVLDAALGYFEAAGFTVADGKVTAGPGATRGTDRSYLEYEIIIPADGKGEHPAYAILTASKEALAKIGITLTINDPADSNVLWDALKAGTEDMWTAAWQATVDPDMYQIYYSTNCPGMGGSDSNNYHITSDELDKLILEGRTSDDQSYRKAVYKQAIDIILDWAVEIPNYQRKNCTIFSPERINIDTITPDITTYYLWWAEINNMEMKAQ